MKDILYRNTKVELRKSNLHGYGVFANNNIKEGEIIEECYFINLDKKIDELDQYKFNWPRYPKNPINLAMPFGYACIYNTASKEKKEQEQNADWITDEENELFIFKAVKNIQKDKELLIYYGDDWFEYHKNINNRVNKIRLY